LTLSIIIGSLSVILLSKLWIRFFSINQTIRDGVPETHNKKNAVAMGGLCFIIPIIILNFNENKACLSSVICFAIIGLIDDILKIKKRSGVTAKQKFNINSNIGLDSGIWLFEYKLNVHIFFVILFKCFVLIATSNAANLTDGIDGLLSSVSTIIFIFLGIMAFQMGEISVSRISFISAGCTFGFLYFNINPARIFMGDTGSLAIGGLIGAISVSLKREFLLIPFCIVFVLETLSVITQVLYFKYTKRQYGDGRRIFSKAPIHHHLEHLGWTESQIMIRACIITTIVSLMFL
jgi:phospho-N-acetylmuramoyl-pentapeptide-transferase